MLIRDAEVDGRRVDVRLSDGVLAELGAGLDRRQDEEALDADGGALLPGLHDHHVHLWAMAAARASVVLHPGDDVGARLRGAAPGWVRAIGYHDSMAGPLDRWRIDALAGDRPVRVQHRSGELWVVNSAAAREIGLPEDHDGRFWRQDAWLRERVPAVELDLAGVGRDAAHRGVTGFTDTTPDRPADDARALADAGLPQRLHLMLPPGLDVPDRPLVTAGPVKVLLDDATLPPVDELTALFAEAASTGRGVAVHCVTRVQLIAVLAAGLRAGDRIEHGAVIPTELIGALAQVGAVVVTQPNFAVERAEQYRADVDADDLDSLYRCRSLLDDGVAVAAGTDAPFGGSDPWAAMRAAVSRDLGPAERVDAATALGLFLGAADAPAARRRVEVGVPADLCLLAVPLAIALEELDASNVRAAFVAGDLVISG